jgi:5'-nucleotidase
VKKAKRPRRPSRPSGLRILLSNDDGIHAIGLRALTNEMVRLGEVWTVAPEREMSATGHAITIEDPLRVRKESLHPKARAYSVTGTPADCVKLAVRALMKGARPHVVVSGVNRGANIARNLIYSGTVSAATEGAILGISSIAVSLAGAKLRPSDAADFRFAARFARRLVRFVLREGLVRGTLLNVNIPRPPVRGVRITRQAESVFVEKFDKRRDPHGAVYYWQAGDMQRPNKDSDADDHVVREGYISITPIHHDLTHYKSLARMARWGTALEKGLKF